MTAPPATASRPLRAWPGPRARRSRSCAARDGAALARSPPAWRPSGASRSRRCAAVVPPESWRASLCGFPVGGRGVLVVDRAHHARGAVPAVVVVEAVAPVQHDGLGLAGVGELVAGEGPPPPGGGKNPRRRGFQKRTPPAPRPPGPRAPGPGGGAGGGGGGGPFRGGGG